MKTFTLLNLLAGVLVFTRPVNAEDAASVEKIRDTSPDQNFAVRISCSSEAEDPNASGGFTQAQTKSAGYTW